MTNKLLGEIEILAAVLVIFTAMLNPKISLIFAVSCLVLLGVYKIFGEKKSDLDGNPLNPEQIETRRENLEKIMSLAKKKKRISAPEVQRYLRVSEDTALRYLSYLVELGKLVSVGDRGQKVHFELPLKYN